MARQGMTSVQIKEETNVPAGTAADWIRIARREAQAENRDPMLTDGSYRLAFLGQRIQQSQLEELVKKIENDESTLPWGVLTNIITGTNTDKLTRREGAVQVNVQFNLVTRDPD